MSLRIKSLWREPLLHFLLIGVLLFVVFDLRQGESSGAPDRVLVDGVQVKLMASRFERTRLRPPTSEELQGLIEDYVREEIYYREALALGLDSDDPIVRRRMRTKLEFMLDDLSALEPSETALQDYLARYPERYEIDARISFRQVFLSASKHTDLTAEADRVLRQLQQGAGPETVGDASLLPASFSEAAESLVARTFGDDFSQALFTLEPGGWAGPVYSAFGAHLVKVGGRIAARAPALDEVRDQVARDYLAEQREQQKETTYRRLRDRYEVVVETPAESDMVNGAMAPEAKAASE